MRILALDIATHTGWAYFDGTKISGGGVWDFSVKRDESSSMKFIRLKGSLCNVLKEGIDLVVFEAARHGASHMQGALVCQAELQAIVKNWCDENGGISYRGYSPTEIKKFATGKGNSPKDIMVKAAKSAFRIKIVDDNHADALWLLAMATKEYARTDVTNDYANSEEYKLSAIGKARPKKRGSG